MKRRLRAAAFTILIVLPWVTGAVAGGSRIEDIPLGSWVYDAVFELSTQGHFENLLLHTRPYTRGEVTDAVRFMAGHSDSLSAGERILLVRLRSEFAEELADSESTIRAAPDQTVRLGGGPTARIDQFHEGYAKNRIGFDAGGSFTVAGHVAARVRLRVDTDALPDSQFHGQYWKHKFTAWIFDQGVITGQFGRVHLAFGREFWRWGPSPVDALLISDHSPPFDGLRLSYRARTWSFSFIATMLDSTATDPTDPGEPPGFANRYLIGHRFNWRPRRNLELALSEVVVFGGVDRPWALNYLNPLIPYYWEQLNNNTNDNPLWNIEISFRPHPRLEIYGEWMIDDFQIDFVGEPQQIGGLGGVTWSPRELDGRLFLSGEYERINTFVYGQGKSWNRFVHDRDLYGNVIGIGSDLGTDADRLTFRSRCHLSPLIDVTGLAESIRRGEDRIENPQAGSAPNGVPFPSGIVERQLTLGLGLHGQRGGHFIVDIQGGYQKTQNVGHAMGVDRHGGYFQLRLSCQWWRTFGV